MKASSIFGAGLWLAVSLAAGPALSEEESRSRLTTSANSEYTAQLVELRGEPSPPPSSTASLDAGTGAPPVPPPPAPSRGKSPPVRCRLEVARETGVVWTLEKCIGAVDDVYLVSNDADRVWILH